MCWQKTIRLTETPFGLSQVAPGILSLYSIDLPSITLLSTRCCKSVWLISSKGLFNILPPLNARLILIWHFLLFSIFCRYPVKEDPSRSTIAGQKDSTKHRSCQNLPFRKFVSIGTISCRLPSPSERKVKPRSTRGATSVDIFLSSRFLQLQNTL